MSFRDTALGKLIWGSPATAPTGSVHLAWPDTKEQSTSSSSRTRLIQVGSGNNTQPGGSSERMKDFASYLKAVTIPTVYMAASVIAYNYAAAPMVVYDENEEVVDIRERHPELATLLERPNPQADGFTFRETLAYDLILCGNAITAKDEYTLDGLPTSLWRLRPDRVTIKTQPDGSRLYIYGARDGSMTEPVVYGEHEIMHQKQANPFDPIWGLGVIEAGEVAFSADRRISEFKLGYFDRGAILDGVLTTDGDMADDEYDRLLTRWKTARGGGRTTFKTAILWQGAKYQPIQEPMGSVPIVDLVKMARNEVLQLFGVPPAKLGDFSGTNYRNAQEADAFFWTDTMQPLLRRSEAGWTDLVRLWDPGYHVRFEVRDVIDYVNRATTAQRIATTGSFTRNDIRVSAGYSALPQNDPRGQEFIATTPGFQSFDPETMEPTINLPGTADTTGNDQSTDSTDEITERPKPTVTKPKKNPAPPQPINHPSIKSVDEMEARIMERIEERFTQLFESSKPTGEMNDQDSV